MQKKLMMWVFAGLAIFLCASCDGGSGNGPDAGGNVRPPELTGKAVVFGKIVDANTGLGIGGAQVKLEIGNVYELVTQSFPAAAPAAEPAKSDISLNATWEKSVGKAEGEQQKVIIPATKPNEVPLDNGDFLFRDIPEGVHKLSISLPGYATYSRIIDINNEDDGVFYYNASPDNLSVKLYKAFDAQVVLALDGVPVGGTAVYLNEGTEDEKVAQTDEKGVATFASLSQQHEYKILVPSGDVDKDGRYDYVTYADQNLVRKYNDSMLAVWPVRLIKIIPGQAVEFLDSDCGSRLTFGNGCTLQAGDSIRILMNQPVQLKEEAKTILTSIGPDLAVQPIVPAAGGAAQVLPHEVSATLSLAAANTVIVVTPDAANSLKDNYTYHFKQLPLDLLYTNDGVLVDAPLVFDRTYYISPVAQLNATAIMYDNYNGEVKGDRGAVEWRLKFPKRVKGTITLLAYTQDGVEKKLDGNEQNPLPIDNWLNDGEALADHKGLVDNEQNKRKYGCLPDESCGGNTVYWTYPYNPTVSGHPLSLKDNTDLKANNITVHIVATDAQGYSINEEVILPVL